MSEIKTNAIEQLLEVNVRMFPTLSGEIKPVWCRYCGEEADDWASVKHNADYCPFAAAMAQLTALRARVAQGEAGWEAFDRVQRNEWIVATAYDGQNLGYVVNTRDGEPRNGSQHFKQEMQTFAPTARGAATKGLELLAPESSHA